MNLKLIVVSVIMLFLLNNCTPKIEYIQPDLTILTNYNIKSISTIEYETRKSIEGKDVEVIIKPAEFDRIVNWVKEATNANMVLNNQIRKYNKYAKEENENK